MIRAFFIAFILIFSCLAEAQVCIKLEGIEIGCVPSESHTCFINKHPKAEGNKDGECTYARKQDPATGYLPIGVQWEDPTGAIAWHCSAYETKQTCQQIGDQTICQTSNLCKEYSHPTCKKKCVQCYHETQKIHVATSGCIVCTRPRCPDEPDLDADLGSLCPPVHPDNANFIRPREGNKPTCGANADKPFDCPKTAQHVIEATGEIRDFPVDELTPDCVLPDPNEIHVSDQTTQGYNCPWIRDIDRSFNKDTPPTEIARQCGIPPSIGNRFPQDCCGCIKGGGPNIPNVNPPVECKSCANQTYKELGCSNPN